MIVRLKVFKYLLIECVAGNTPSDTGNFQVVAKQR